MLDCQPAHTNIDVCLHRPRCLRALAISRRVRCGQGKHKIQNEYLPKIKGCFSPFQKRFFLMKLHPQKTPP
jgi:hypothetical protein